LIVLETAGWEKTDALTKSALQRLLRDLEGADVQLLSRASHPLVAQLEAAIAAADGICNAITGWENRWGQRNLVDQNPDGVSDRAKASLVKAEAMSLTDYRSALLQREAAQLAYARIAPLADAIITLSSPGPAPPWSNDTSTARPTGDAVFNYPSSMLFVPAITAPMMAIGGVPVGVQLMGQQHDDARVTAIARWLLGSVSPIIAD
jgi:Asp-tRNA(Asn)/Glu-tRNA(Gln) amidotransferase A subunit family amidase